MNRRHWIAFSLFVLLIPVLASGCQKAGTAAKTAALNALAANAGIVNDAFSGSASFQLPASGASANGGMVASGIAQLLRTSSYSWKGVESTNPVRLEADVTITPQGAAEGMHVPVLLKDNKMYVQIPTISPNNDYFVIDPAEMKDVAGSELSFDKLKSSSATVSGMMKTVLSAIDDKYFKQTGKDPAAGTTIEIAVTQKNIGAIARSLYPKLPEIADELQQGGLMTDSQAQQLKQAFDPAKADERAQTITATKPGRLLLVIDSKGFVSRASVSLALTVKKDGQDVPVAIELDQQVSQINANPPFTKAIPEHAQNFAEILKQLGAAPQAAQPAK